MLQIARWLGRRAKCAVVGHRLTGARVFRHGTIMPGYECERCGKTQSLAYRWQEVETDA
ncbi:hypothetical protein [Halorhabdus amylolytica]|uniref:hypothetical protein n=1 Tax=Halorhabdus amylolytica TaxID=2559573 RepID=UPI00145B29CA|nr:hypothetical protein [Halorhabdus amylolytica]